MITNNAISVPWSDGELEMSWARRARARFLGPARPRKHPRGFLVAGLPGAGKSTMVTCLRDLLRDVDGCAWIDSHSLRELHPANTLPDKSNDLATHIEAAAANLADMLLGDAVAQRLDVLVECDWRTAADARGMLESLRHVEYELMLVIVAAPRTVRHTSAQASRIQQPTLRPEIPSTNHPVPEEGHYFHVILEEIESSALVDELYLVSRDGKCLGAACRSQGFTVGLCREIMTAEEGVHSPMDGGIALSSLASSQPPERSAGPDKTDQDSANTELESAPHQAAIQSRIKMQQALRRCAAAERNGVAT